jgi:hypothetical protein
MNETSIRELAHHIWESEGMPEGQAERHWILASRITQANEHNHHYTHIHNAKISIDPSEVKGSTEPEQPDQT